MTAIQIKSLSILYPSISNVIVSPIVIVDQFGSGNKLSSFGLWDTGATGSMITKSAVQKLALIPKGKTRVKGVHDARLVDVYIIRLILNNTDVQFTIEVAECDQLSPDNKVEILIGMDIITKGDFIITNLNKQTVMSFRVPSVQKVDFVSMAKSKQPFIASVFPGRNDPCPCGSGEKYKHCHGKGK